MSQSKLKRKFLVLGPNSDTTTKPQDSSFAETLRNLDRYAPSASSADACIFLDLDDDPSKVIPKSLVGAPVILIRQEPRVVLPQNYRVDYMRNITLVIDVGRPPREHVTRVNWPQTWTLEHLEAGRPASSTRLDKFAVVNANKMSFVKGEMYSLRRMVAQKSPEVHIWGFDWEIPKNLRSKRLVDQLSVAVKHGSPLSLLGHRGWFNQPLIYRGTAHDKLETLAQYEYSLVIENSIDYMSEKLFDCLMAGTFPVYVGPDPLLFGIPEFAYIRAKPNQKSILNAFSLAREIDLDVWRDSITTWLRSEGIEQEWSSKFVTTEIVRKIDDHISEKLD